MRVLRSWLLAGLVPAAILGVLYAATRRSEPLGVRATAAARGKVEKSVAGTKAGAVRSRRVSDLSVETA
ncbi:MAG TPA: hypothetical protein VJU16_07190, partial [Planctomycetota bacterium]|nr:hypothetical protein [Planctomycetota bacterium]